MNTTEISMNQNMSIQALRDGYLSGRLTPRKLMADIRERAGELLEHNIWIHLLTAQEQEAYVQALEEKDIESSPLWGIPFAIKDNIDLAGIPTTAACKEFAYTPNETAVVVQQLIDAGAIPVGKTNMDQFATGLNGTRSPWGACKNAFNKDYISGGSSAGSAVAVALGLATFSLGTDTAGSGRVPACFNNLIGLKPSRGLLSATGLVPACQSLDCMTVFAFNTDDANAILAVAEGFDAQDEYSRHNPYSNQSRHYGEYSGANVGVALKVGIIPKDQLDFFGDATYESAYDNTLNLLQANGAELIEIDYAPFEEAAKLLYEGPWVAERYIATLPLIKENPAAMFPVVRDIIEPGGKLLATDLFKAQYRLNALKKICDEQISQFDCLLTPTAGTCFTIDEMLEQPIARNSQLGRYTNFMNLLDYASIAVPTQITEKSLPFGITLVSTAFSDRALLSMARRIHKLAELTQGVSAIPTEYPEIKSVTDSKMIDVLVCGAHLQGQPLNWQLTERGATLKSVTQTAPAYKMYALAGGPPKKPGLIYDTENGAAIDVEIWTMPAEQFGTFVSNIPSPLGIGKVKLGDNSYVSGFICEPCGLEGAEDITHFGGWLPYIAQI